MSSAIAIRRPASPTESSSAISTSALSTSSIRSTHVLIYTRDELLALATSPLSQASAPAAIAAFPEIMRRTRRGVLEAYQTLKYARGTNVPAPKPNTTSRSRSPRAQYTNLPPPPPVWTVDVYVPPARRVEQEQRVRPGRDVRAGRTWRRPGQTRW